MAASGVRHGRCAAQRHSTVRRDGAGKLQRPGVHDGAVAADLVGQPGVLVEVGEIEVIADGQEPALLVVADHPSGALDVLELQEPRMRSAVGRDQPVDAEVAVMDGLAMVAPVQMDLPARLVVARQNRVIAPLPHEAPARVLVGENDLPVVLEVPGAVAHGVAVLHQDEGLVRVGAEVVADLLQGRVHPGVQVDVGVVVAALGVAVVGALVVRDPGGVGLLHPGQRRLEGAAVGAFVARRPGDDARPVPLPDHAAAHPIERGLRPGRVVRDRLVPVLDLVVPGGVSQETGLGSVALVVGLGHDDEPVLVAQLVEAGVIGVVGAAHRVDVVPLHEGQVAVHVLQVDHRPGGGVGVVAVDAAQGQRPPVQAQDGIDDIDLAQPHPIGDHLVLR